MPYHHRYLDTETLQAYLKMKSADSVSNGVSFLGNDWSLYDLLNWYESTSPDEWMQVYKREVLERERSEMRTNALLDAMSRLLEIPAPDLNALPLIDAQGTIGTPEQWEARQDSQYAASQEIRRVLEAMKAKYSDDHPLMQLFYQEAQLQRQRESDLHRLQQLARYADAAPRPPSDRIEPRHVRFPDTSEPSPPVPQQDTPPADPTDDDWETL